MGVPEALLKPPEPSHAGAPGDLEYASTPSPPASLWYISRSSSPETKEKALPSGRVAGLQNAPPKCARRELFNLVDGPNPAPGMDENEYWYKLSANDCSSLSVGKSYLQLLMVPTSCKGPGLSEREP